MDAVLFAGLLAAGIRLAMSIGIAALGEVRHTPGHIIDLVPTILEAAGGKPLEKWEGEPVPKAPGKT